MIQIKYTLLFEIEFRHDYYTDKLCRDFSLIPSAECAGMLQSAGLRYVVTATGAKIFARVNEAGGKDVLQRPLPENVRLTFLLVPRNRSFSTFTQLNLHTETNQHYYFNNLRENSGGGNVVHLVSDTAGKKLSNGDLKTFRSGSYRFTNGTDVDESAVMLRFSDTGAEFQQLLSAVGGNSRKIFSFDLSNGYTGRAELLVQAVSKDSFYVKSPADRNDLFGIIEIFHRASLPANNKFVDTADNSVTARKFIIQFANRQTTWRYHVIRKYSSDVTSVTIKKENGTVIDFETAPGSTPDLFIRTSKNPIPLTEASLTGIKMKDNNNNEIIAHLPNASLQVLKEEGGKEFSDIFITI